MITRSATGYLEKETKTQKPRQVERIITFLRWSLKDTGACEDLIAIKRGNDAPTIPHDARKRNNPFPNAL